MNKLIITLCAQWFEGCPYKKLGSQQEQTENLEKLGYAVSHGACVDCAKFNMIELSRPEDE